MRHFEAGERRKRTCLELQVHMCECNFINMYTCESMDWQWKHFSAEALLGTCEGLQTFAVDHKSVLRNFHLMLDSFPKGMAMIGLGNPLGFKEPVRDRPVPTICNHMGTCWKAESKIFKKGFF